MAKKPASFEYNAKLIKVLDGDTIDAWIDLGFDLMIKKRIRYMGIDTWESRTKNLEEKKLGLAAKARNRELLEKGNFKVVSHGSLLDILSRRNSHHRRGRDGCCY